MVLRCRRSIWKKWPITGFLRFSLILEGKINFFIYPGLYTIITGSSFSRERSPADGSTTFSFSFYLQLYKCRISKTLITGIFVPNQFTVQLFLLIVINFCPIVAIFWRMAIQHAWRIQDCVFSNGGHLKPRHMMSCVT